MDLSPLTSVTNSYLDISSDGTGAGNVASTIDLADLSSFSEGNYIYVIMAATNGGTVYFGEAPSPSQQGILIDAGGQVQFTGYA